ncbi:hypothetical protein F511_19348 [Dorcoceras hygrometricum]|uniref:Uncharacterized protein n=1 Tax=Dorcoceras hygrometricum TaxID=472368 RepID=A0A2Z7CF02_9LAMI|nr:hypothetical protein F511_19348 [Dorcoceras hygrometricum]
MEPELQSAMLSSPSVYATAPNSPNPVTKSNSMEFSSSAPVSPRRKTGDLGSDFDEFEFETSKIFGGQSQFDGDQEDDGVGDEWKIRGRGDSLPAMAFADEIFLNGLVMPLKLPPRLQYDGDFSSFSQRSSPLVSSPKSPRMACRFPFGRKSGWNDGFDPFLVALQKVREEKAGRSGQRRRSRSHSPFRIVSKCSSDLGSRSTELSDKENIPTHRYSGPLECKGSAYARWVRDQTREALNQQENMSPRGYIFGQPATPVKLEHIHENVAGGNGANGETKVQKLKGFLLRYASFRREKSASAVVKEGTVSYRPSYFSKLSFKFKQNGNGSGKKRMPSDKSMAVVEYKPSASFALCLGYGVGSPKG